MELNEYMVHTWNTAIYPEAGTGKDIELFYLALGLTSEAGEVAGKIKKYIRDGTLSQQDLGAEIGDVFWYLVRLCHAIGYRPEDVLDKNIGKLYARKDKGTLSGSGDAR